VVEDGELAGEWAGEWETHAEWWAEHYSEGADVEYTEQILPLLASELSGSRRVVDVGCGEGQVARLAVGAGSRVIGVDAAWNQVSIARSRGGGPAYGRALATRLPFADSCFDAAVACLVLEHLDDLTGAAAEIARVLRPGGRLCCVLNHPLTQTPGSGLIDDHTVNPSETYWRLGHYLVEQSGDEQVANGVFIRFVHRPLSRYVNAFADVGLTIQRMVEPPPPDVRTGPALDPLAAAVPRLMYLRFGSLHADG
jgi:SAM-dependent methyltransferase